MRKNGTLRRQIRFVLAVSGFGGAGMVLLGPVGLVLGALLLFAMMVFAGAAVFSRREEPMQRVLKLIKALLRKR